MRLSRILAAWLALAPGLLVAQEGIATFKYVVHANSAGPEAQSRVFFSPTAARVELQMTMNPSADANRSRPAGAPTTFKSTMISKLSEPDRLYTVNDERRTYSVMDLAKIRESQMERERPTYTVQRQGSDRVGGVACDKALITSSKGDQIEVCVSREISMSSSWLSAMNRQPSRRDTWFKAMSDSGLKGFPIRMKFHPAGKAGDEVDMELVSLEKKSLPASTFQIPADYRETDATTVNMTPEQARKMQDAMSKMTPEQRKAMEDAMKAQGKKE